MAPDTLQQAWRAQASQTRVAIDADLLRKKVQRNQRNFRAMTFWRDFREIGASLLLLPYWLYTGITQSLPWTWWLGVPALVWVIGFVLLDRMRHKRKPREPGEPLLKSVQESLIQVEHQIWLLRNVFWWYLLPFAISSLAFVAQVTWLTSKNWLEAIAAGGLLFVFLLGLYYFIDFINQRAVRTQLEPRRQNLLTLLTGLRDETARDSSMKSRASSERPRILRRWLIVAVLCLVILMVIAVASAILETSYDGPPDSSGPAGDSLATMVTDLRKEKNLVGLAAMVTVDGRVVAAAASGERMKRSGMPLEIGDCWHLGGITKCITATMIARLVESGRMQWSDTLGECFPNASMHQDWKPVTLRQLLTDTAGAPANFPQAVWRERPALGRQCTQARRAAVLNVLAEPPAYPPGKSFAYSNVGYTIAGAMAEQMTGASWEELVKREVFEPLGLSKSGFGPPESGDETLEQPRGHRKVLVGKFAMDDKADNTPIIGPAATAHMSLSDLCAFATEHLRGNRGAGELLAAETYQLLHTPSLDHYACGWVKRDSSHDFPYTAYWHNGSNTMWYALVVFIPEKDMVVAVTSNDGDSVQAEAAAWKIVVFSVNQLGVEGDAERRNSTP